MLDSKTFEELKKISQFNRKTFNQLNTEYKLRYLYNWLQFKQMEANQYGITDNGYLFYNYKEEIVKLLRIIDFDKCDEKLYNKKLECLIKKIEVETDFL